MKNLILLVACVGCIAPQVYSQTWSDYGEVTPALSTFAAGYNENELQLSGNGSMFIIGAGFQSMAAVYKRVNSVWSQIGSTLSVGSSNTEYYGKTTKISDDGNTIAIGAPRADTSGLVYIYRWNGTDWDQLGETITHVAVGYDQYDRFGEDIALSGNGNIIAIGAHKYDTGSNNNEGIAKMYSWNGTSWNQRGQSIVGESHTDYAGLDLDLSYDGNIVAVASINDDSEGSDSGHARIFEYTNTQWTKMGGDIDGENAGDNLGRDIAIAENGHTVIVGLKDCDNDNDGCAKVYKWNGTTWNQHGQTLFGDDPSQSFGYSVAISEDGNVVAIGDQGKTTIRVFVFNNTHWNTVGQEISGDSVGTTLTISDDGTIVASTNQAHKVYLYQVDTSFTPQPTGTQTNAPTKIPTDIPSDIPTDIPSDVPTAAPTCYSVSTTATTKTITVNCNITGVSLSTICGTTCTDHSNVTIIGQGSDTNTNNYWTWHDFQFLYTLFQYGTLHFQNIRLYTDTIDGYAVYSKNTQTTMENVVITGYSGRQGEDGGGAMRIRNADYSSLNHNKNNPTLKNVVINDNCRGFRIQDCTGAYIYDCKATDNTDNSFYFAAGTYTSASGCHDSTFDTCTAINSGQTAFMNIGGTNNTFKNLVVDTTRGAGMYIWNTNDIILAKNISFTNANTAHRTTPWGGSTDDARGASIAIGVKASDTNAKLNIDTCTFNGGGILNQKTPEDSNVDAYNSTVLETTNVDDSSNPPGPGYIEFIGGMSTYDDTQYDYDTPWVISSFVNTSLLLPMITQPPTDIPTDIPSDLPTDIPTDIPTDSPTAAPTCYSVSTTATTKTITVNCNITGISLSTICGTTCDTDHSNVRIIGQGSDTNTNNYWTWHDFQFEAPFVYMGFTFGQHYTFGTLHIENIQLYTTSLNTFAISSISTLTTMKDVSIVGYSGRTTETDGGAISIAYADYSSLNNNKQSPTFQNIYMESNCRGMRLVNSHNVYINGCTAKDNTDNSFLAANLDKTTSVGGCFNITLDSCTAINSGQSAFMTIAGGNITIKNSIIDTSRGAGVAIFNTNDTMLLKNTSFTNANTAHLSTPWGGTTDDARGASVALGVPLSNTNAKLNIDACMFYGGGVLNQKTPENNNIDAYNSTVFETTTAGDTSNPPGPGRIEFINGMSEYDHLEYDADLPWIPSAYVNTSLLLPMITQTPTDIPTDIPSDIPSDLPTDIPTDIPSDLPTDIPTDIPTDVPSDLPSDIPSDLPTDIPTDSPTDIPTDIPTVSPTLFPTPEMIENEEVPVFNAVFGTNSTNLTLEEIAPQLTQKYETVLTNIISNNITSVLNVSFFTKVSLVPQSQTRRRRNTGTVAEREYSVESIAKSARVREQRAQRPSRTLNNCTQIADKILPTNYPEFNRTIFLGLCNGFDELTIDYVDDCQEEKLTNLRNAAQDSGVERGTNGNSSGIYNEFYFFNITRWVSSQVEFCINKLEMVDRIQTYASFLQERYGDDTIRTRSRFKEYWDRVNSNCILANKTTCAIKEVAEFALVKYILSQTSSLNALSEETIDVTDINGNNISLAQTQNVQISKIIITEPPTSPPTPPPAPQPKYEEESSSSMGIIAGASAGAVLIFGGLGCLLYSRSKQSYSAKLGYKFSGKKDQLDEDTKLLQDLQHMHHP